MLCEQLAARFNLVYHHEGPPPQNIPVLEHYGALLDAARGKHVIFDRLALGERVYGQLLRNNDRLGYRGQVVFDRLVNAVGAVKVMCLPTFDTCLRNWSSGRPELIKDPAVLSHTFTEFASLSAGCIMYDYEAPQAFEKLEAHLANWRSRQYKTLPPGMVGDPDATFIILGDRGSNPKALVDLPFFSTENSSDYLNRALELAGFREHDTAFMNAYTIHGQLNQFKQQWLVNNWSTRRVIALGNAAGDACRDQKLTNFQRVPHPQFWKRFHHHDIEGYAQLLRDARC